MSLNASNIFVDNSFEDIHFMRKSLLLWFTPEKDDNTNMVSEKEQIYVDEIITEWK